MGDQDVVLLDRSLIGRRTWQFASLVPTAFFLLLGGWAVAGSALAAMSGAAGARAAAEFLAGLGLVLVMWPSLRGAMRGAFGAVREVSGLLEHAARVRHQSARSTPPFWRLVVEGREFQIYARSLKHEELLAPGRPVCVQFAADGEVLKLTADNSASLPEPKLPPSGTPSALSSDELRRAGDVLVRSALINLLIAGAGVCFGWLFADMGAWLVTLTGVFALAFIAAGADLVRAAMELKQVAPGMPSVVAEGRYQRVLGVGAAEYIGARRLLVAATKRPHGLARYVRARGITVRTPWSASASIFVVVEWLASSA